jgi:hypothetical protein
MGEQIGSSMNEGGILKGRVASLGIGLRSIKLT